MMSETTCTCWHCRLDASDVRVRAQAISQQLARVEVGRARGGKALVVGVGSGLCVRGEASVSPRYLDSMHIIYSALPADWVMYIERRLGSLDWSAEIGSRCKPA